MFFSFNFCVSFKLHQNKNLPEEKNSLNQDSEPYGLGHSSRYETLLASQDDYNIVGQDGPNWGLLGIWDQETDPSELREVTWDHQRAIRDGLEQELSI